jgi:hypothetical protein
MPINSNPFVVFIWALYSILRQSFIGIGGGHLGRGTGKISTRKLKHERADEGAGVRVRVRLKGFFLVPKSHQYARAQVSSCLSFTDPLGRFPRKSFIFHRVSSMF